MRQSSAVDSARKMDGNTARQLKNENISKVQEYIQRDANFYADLALRNDCLKQMTAQQFFMIVDHFSRLITGKKLDTFIHSGDPAEGVLEFMRQLNYPFTVNKSMLKTPNAPHTFDNVVMMLRWLGEISEIPYLGADDAFIDGFLLHQDKCLPNAEFTAEFSKSVQRGYSLWNNESEEHTALMDGLTDHLVCAKLDGKVNTVAELNALTDRLDAKSEELRANPVRLHNVHQYEELESKYTEYETKEHGLINEIEERRDRLAAITVNWTDKCNKVKQSQSQMSRLAKQIHNQPHSIDGYKKLSQDMVLLKKAIETLRSEIQKIESDEANQQIVQARLLKKCSEAIIAMNERAIKIIKMLKNAHIRIEDKIDLNDVQLPPNPTPRQAQKVVNILSKIYSVVKIQKINIQIELERTSITLKTRKTESHLLDKNYEAAQKKYKHKCFDLEANEQKMVMKNKKNENCARKVSQQTEGSKSELDELKLQIQEVSGQNKQMQEENARFMEEAEAKSKEIIEMKQLVVQHLDALEKELDKAIDEMIILSG